MRVKAIAEARMKTDSIDAGILCDLLPEAYYAPRCVRDWKELSRVRALLVHIRTQLTNKIHADLATCGVRSPVNQVFGAAGRAWLAELALPDAFRHALAQYVSSVEALDEHPYEPRLPEKTGMPASSVSSTSV
jgi:transposase